MKYTLLLLLMLFTIISYSQPKKRVLSYSWYRNTGTNYNLVDSTIYTYSNGRGSSLSPAENLFFFNDHYGIDATVQCDTAKNYLDSGNGLQKHTAVYARYNNAHKRMSFEYWYATTANLLQPSEKWEAVRDANGNVIKQDYYLSVPVNQWGLYQEMGYIYDSLGRLIVDSSTGDFYFFEKNVHIYDTRGLLSSKIHLGSRTVGLYDTTQRLTYEYDSGGVLKAITQWQCTNNNWVQGYTDSFGYDAMGRCNFKSTIDRTANSKPYSKEERQFLDTTGNPTIIQFYTWNSSTEKWENHRENILSYDADNLLTRMESYDYVQGKRDTNPFWIHNIYYETYYNVDITNPDTKEGNIFVYPNPANDYVYLKLNTPGKKGKVQLTDMFGGVVLTTNYNANMQQVKIDVAHLPAGNYIISYNDGMGTAHQQIVTLIR